MRLLGDLGRLLSHHLAQLALSGGSSRKVFEHSGAVTYQRASLI